MPAPQSHAIQTRSPSTPVQLAAAAVLLQEGVEGGEENHGRSIADSAMDEHVPTRIQKAAAIGAGGV